MLLRMMTWEFDKLQTLLSTRQNIPKAYLPGMFSNCPMLCGQGLLHTSYYVTITTPLTETECLDVWCAGPFIGIMLHALLRWSPSTCVAGHHVGHPSVSLTAARQDKVRRNTGSLASLGKYYNMHSHIMNGGGIYSRNASALVAFISCKPWKALVNEFVSKAFAWLTLPKSLWLALNLCHVDLWICVALSLHPRREKPCFHLLYNIHSLFRGPMPKSLQVP